MNASAEPFQRHRYTVDEYRRMVEHGIIDADARVELIEGEIIDVPPIGSTHGGIVNQLNRALGRAVGDAAIVHVQNTVVLGDHSQPQPDIALLRPRDDFYKRANPGPEDVLLAIEVADSTLAYDREVKVPLYARHGIVETWLIDVKGRRVTAFREPGPDGYGRRVELAELGAVAPLLLPEAVVDLSGLF